MVTVANHNQQWQIPVVKTIATDKKGIDELLEAIASHQHIIKDKEKQHWLLAEKAYHLVQQKRMTGVRKEDLKVAIANAGADFNLYEFVDGWSLVGDQ